MAMRSEEHTSELQSRGHLVCRLLLEKKKRKPRQAREPAASAAAAPRPHSTISPPRIPLTSIPRPSVLAHVLPSQLLGCPALLFFFKDPAPTEIYTLSLHDALPISAGARAFRVKPSRVQALRAAVIDFWKEHGD